MEQRKATLTAQEYRTVEAILQKTGKHDLPKFWELLESLTSYSFKDFFSTQPTIIKTLIEAKAKATTAQQEEIENFLKALSRVNEAIAVAKENVEILEDISAFLYECNEAAEQYASLN